MSLVSSKDSGQPTKVVLMGINRQGIIGQHQSRR
jgi:hypothetical protein